MYPPFSPLQLLNDPLFKRMGVEVYVLRLDQYHPQLSGNKYFKLKYNIAEAKDQDCKQLISFGGAYSNHIHAMALAGQQQNISTLGFIRGEETLPLNDTLLDAVNAGMRLHYVSREEYRKRNNPEYIKQLQLRYPNAYIIPEGGSNLLGVKGCMEIVDHIHHHINDQFESIILPCGTAATLAGVAASTSNKTIFGVSVLKNAGYVAAEVNRYLIELGLPDNGNWTVLQDYHCGGYGKVSVELAKFVDRFQQKNDIPIEPIYSGKMFYALYNMLDEGLLTDTRIVAIHTGGLQGFSGMKKKYNKLLSA